MEPATISHRLMGEWEPSSSFFHQLMAKDSADTDKSRPYPFFLAHALDQPVESRRAFPVARGMEVGRDSLAAHPSQSANFSMVWRGEDSLRSDFPRLLLLAILCRTELD